MNPRTPSKQVFSRLFVALVPLALVGAAAGGCSAAPAAQKEAQGPDQKGGGPVAASGKNAGEQFDNGSYNLRKGDRFVGVLFAKNRKELWVLSTATNDISCDANGCDLRNIEIDMKSPGDADCARWKDYANDLVPGTRKIYSAGYTETDVHCGDATCSSTTPTPTGNSLLPTGKYTATMDPSYAGVYVDSSRNEYWLMTASVGTSRGTTIVSRSGDNSADLTAFSCNMCTRLNIKDNTTLKIRGVKYTEQTSGIDCTPVP